LVDVGGSIIGDNWNGEDDFGAFGKHGIRYSTMV